MSDSEVQKNISVSPLGMTEKENDGKPDVFSKIQTFLITLSPKEDIHDLCVQQCAKWFKRNCILYYVVIEHGVSGKRHLHAMVVTREFRETRRLQNDFWVKVKKWHPTSLGCRAVKVQVCPGNDWYHEYLQKEGSKEIVCDEWDPAEAEQYFPTKSVQEALILAHKKPPGDAFMLDHELRWMDMFPDDDSYASAMRYFNTRMNVVRDMRVINDLRRLRQLAMALHRFRVRAVEPTAGDQRFFSQEQTVWDFSHS